MTMEAVRQLEADGQTVWVIDPAHTTAEFVVKNFFVFTVRGSVATVEGTIVLDTADIRHSSVSAVLDPASIQTGSERRDAHLRAADFLDADHYPEIRFQSTQVGLGTDRDTLRVTGSLTIKDRSKEIVLEVSETDRSRSPSGEYVGYYSARTEIDRLDFGISYMGLVIGRMVQITINVQATGRV